MCGHELAMSLRAAYLAMHRRMRGAAHTGVTADQFLFWPRCPSTMHGRSESWYREQLPTPNTVRAMLVLLERRGLFKRRIHPGDGRGPRSVSLTQRGRSVFWHLWRECDACVVLVTALSPAESGVLADQSRRIANA